MQGAVERLGGLGAKVNGRTVEACCEFNAANPLLKANPNVKASEIPFSDANRPRTGQTINTCPLCQVMFGYKN